MFRNLITLLLGEVPARILNALAIILLLRKLGTEAMGQFAIASAAITYLSLIVQQGLDIAGVREVARQHADARKWAATIIGLRLALACIVGTALAGWLILTGGRTSEVRLFGVFGLLLFTTAIQLRWLFQGLEQPRAIAATTLAAQLVFFGAALAVRHPDHVIWAAAAQVGGEIVSAAALWLVFVARNGSFRPRLDIAAWIDLLRTSWPLAVSTMLGTLLYNFDVLALGLYQQQAGAGLYLACYRCMNIFVQLFSFWLAVVFPRVARTYPDWHRTSQLMMWLCPAAFTVMLIPAVVITIWAQPILRLLYGEAYVGGAALLQVLIWSLPLQALRSTIRQGILAHHLQHQDSLNMAFAVATNATLDLTLIPRYGPMACAVATFAAEVVLLVRMCLTYRRASASAAPSAPVEAAGLR